MSSLAKSGVAIARLVNIHILENHHAVIIINTSQSLYSVSRHTVVCRAAQEAGAQPREYIDRKKENAIFAPP